MYVKYVKYYVVFKSCAEPHEKFICDMLKLRKKVN